MKFYNQSKVKSLKNVQSILEEKSCFQFFDKEQLS